jgi:hypothetical protein
VVSGSASGADGISYTWQSKPLQPGEDLLQAQIEWQFQTPLFYGVNWKPGATALEIEDVMMSRVFSMQQLIADIYRRENEVRSSVCGTR